MKVNILGEHKCEIELNEDYYLQSYKSIVGNKGWGKITLYPKWNYSRTTVKHVSQWLGIPAKEIHKRIKEGSITVSNTEPEI